MRLIEHMAFTLTDFPKDFHEREDVKKAYNELEEQRKKVLALIPQKQHPIALKELSRLSECYNHYFSCEAEEYFKQGVMIGRQLFEELHTD